MATLEQALRGIRAFATDVDGCLTDGSLQYADDGSEARRFSVLDGLGFRVAKTAGLPLAWISGRRSPLVERRARELEIDAIYQRATDKAWALRDFAGRCGVELAQVAYLGDDLNDLPALRLAGLPMTVPGAAPEVAELARYTTTRQSGCGAARDCLEAILRAQGKWAGAVAEFLEELRRQQGEGAEPG